MRVKAEVLKVSTRETKKGLIAVVYLEVENPGEIVQVTIWAKQVTEGAHRRYEKLTGQKVQLSLSVEVYREKLSYSLFMGGDPVLVKDKESVMPPLAAAK